MCANWNNDVPLAWLDQSSNERFQDRAAQNRWRHNMSSEHTSTYFMVNNTTLYFHSTTPRFLMYGSNDIKDVQTTPPSGTIPVIHVLQQYSESQSCVAIHNNVWYHLDGGRRVWGSRLTREQSCMRVDASSVFRGCVTVLDHTKHQNL